MIPCSAFHHCRLIWIIQREFMEFHRSNETEIENELYCLRLRRQNKTHTNRLDGCSQRGRKREGTEKKANNYKWFFFSKRLLSKNTFYRYCLYCNSVNDILYAISTRTDMSWLWRFYCASSWNIYISVACVHYWTSDAY